MGVIHSGVFGFRDLRLRVWGLGEEIHLLYTWRMFSGLLLTLPDFPRYLKCNRAQHLGFKVLRGPNFLVELNNSD